MLKRLAILGLLFAIAPMMPSQPNKAAEPKQPATNQVEIKGKPTGPNEVDKHNGSQTYQAKPGSDPPAGNTSIERPRWWEDSNWWLVIIAGLTGCMIGFQSWATSEAARGAQKAADAALLNAQAVINAERARLLFEVDKEMDQKRHGVAIFTIYAVNHGRTPARLMRIKGPVETVCDGIDELPIPMKTHPAKLPDKWHVMQGEKCFIARFVPASMTSRALELAKATGESINAQKRVIYGEVLYSDGISPQIRSSRYCFRFNREPFRNIGGSIEPAGPSEFNQTT